MKKIFMLILAVVTLLTLDACGNTVEDNTSSAAESETDDAKNVQSDILTSPQSKHRKGDVTGDGEIALADAQLTLRAALNIITLKDEEALAADVNNDGTISLGDAQMILRAALNIIQIPDETEKTSEPDETSKPGGENMPTVNIQIGSSHFIIKLYDNASTRALLAQMPMTLNMSELNKNEKYYYLPESLPTDSQKVGSINVGDLMLYGSECLVLFYESFSTSYSYTKLGCMDDVSGLVDALGDGNVQVTFTIPGPAFYQVNP